MPQVSEKQQLQQQQRGQEEDQRLVRQQSRQVSTVGKDEREVHVTSLSSDGFSLAELTRAEEESFDLIDANETSGAAASGPSRASIVTKHAKHLKEQLLELKVKETPHQVAPSAATERELNNNEPIATNQKVADRAKWPSNEPQQTRQVSTSPNDLRRTVAQLLSSVSTMDSLGGRNNRGPAPGGNGAKQAPTSSEPADRQKPVSSSQQQTIQSSSIPSYNSIFNTNARARQQQPALSTNLDEEILNSASTNEYKLSTVPAPAQKQRWSPLLASNTATPRTPPKKQGPGDGKKLLVFNYEAPSRGGAVGNELRSSPLADAKDKLSACASDESASGYDENDETLGTNLDDDDDDDDDEEGEAEDEEVDFAPKNHERLAFDSLQKQRDHSGQARQYLNENKLPHLNKQAKQQHLPGSATKSTKSMGKLRSSQSSLKKAGSAHQLGQQKKHNAQQSKISLSEHRNSRHNSSTIGQHHSSANQRQEASCRRVDLIEQTAYLAGCDCAGCAKKKKIAGYVQGHGSAPALAAPSYYQHQQNYHHHAMGGLNKSDPLLEKRYPKTRIMHLILKSIILVLCTLLLILLIVGTAMLSYSLPQAVDKITNVSRSFNVTIAGR